MLLLILLFTLSVLLQIYLSKRKNKWLGLIIPILCFVNSLVMVLSVAVFSTVNSTGVEVFVQNVQVYKEGSEQDPASEKYVIPESEKDENEPSLAEGIAQVAPMFLIFNIPTLGYLGIYIIIRKKLKNVTNLEKMNILDLE